VSPKKITPLIEADNWQPEESKRLGLEDMADSIDLPTFDQNLELDEAGDREFSSAIVFGYFDHAENTFNNMDVAL
jgi:osomolarity two-component system phosphorelay intermediate protein YPD1